jgi:anti-sigma regulatory factor (Ser/Thr protein kinase)
MRVAADAHSATQARVEFRSWLDRHFTLGPERFSDLLLAVSEALANAAEFAYVDSGQPGTMDFGAAYDVDSDSLAVTITDRGRWRPSVPERTPDRRFQIRGRGIPLMQALADEAVIDRTPEGTHVTLRWTYLTRQSPAV